MSIVNTLRNPSFHVGSLRLRPEGGGLTVEPLSISVGPLSAPMAGLKRNAGMAVAALFAGLRASLPVLTR